jgi:hypothetical protein
VVGFIGDADGNGQYTAADGQRILQVVGGTASSFAFWRGIDPVVVADIAQTGTLSAVDAQDTNILAAGGSVAGVPAIPAGLVITTQSIPPFISAPIGLAATPGSVVQVPVSIDRSAPAGSGQLTLSYDTASLELLTVGAGSATGLSVAVARQTPGSVTVDFNSTTTFAPGALTVLDFLVLPRVAPGAQLALNLSAVMIDHQTLASQVGADPTDGLINVVLTPPAEQADVDSTNPVRQAQAQLLSGMAA